MYVTWTMVHMPAKFLFPC